MSPYALVPLPTDLESLCEIYPQSAGSTALRINALMLKYHAQATLADVSPAHGGTFLRLRATILDTLGEVSACRAIYQFAAQQAAGVGDRVGQAAALAQLHVDRSFRLDGDGKHGSPLAGDIRLELLQIFQLLTPLEDIAPADQYLASRTLVHLVHGLALLGAVDDAQEVWRQASMLAVPLAESAPYGDLHTDLALAEAEILCCRGLIDQALENVEVLLGYESADPLGLQIEARQFLATWYRVIEEHHSAWAHLEIATELAYDCGMEPLAVTLAMEQVSSLVALQEDEKTIEVASRALDQAVDLGIYNDVVRTLGLVLVRTLQEAGKAENALLCAEMAGDLARNHADVATAVELYQAGAQAATALGDSVHAAGLYGSCAALATGHATLKAGFLRRQAEEILAVYGLKINLQPSATQLRHPDFQAAVGAAYEVLQEALSLLISVPSEEKPNAAVELAQWNQTMTWVRQYLEADPEALESPQ